LKVLDVEPSEYYRRSLKIYQPQYVEAAEVQRIMDALGITETGEQAPRDQARLEGTGGARPGPARSTPASTSSGAGTAGGLFSRGPGEGMLLPGQEEPEVRMAIQETTNKIYVLATEYQHRDIAEIMKHVDLEPDDDMGAIQIYQLENREPAVVKEMLDSLLEAEKEGKEAAGEGVERIVTIPGKEGAPIIVALEDIYAIAVRGSKKQHEEISKIIKQLDKRLPSVLVEAILVQVNTNDVLDLGVSLQQHTDVGTSGERSVSGISPFGLSPTRVGSMVLGTGGTIAYFDDELIFATLEALQSQGDSKIASMPRVLVNDNETGTIVSQREEPTIQTTIQPGSDTPILSVGEWVSAGTTLGITPHISEGDFLKLEIDLKVDSFDGKGSGGIPPPKSVNNVTTIVTVPNGKYIVLGGLTSKTESTTVSKVPLLGDIPIIGLAFRNVSRSDIENVLYVFVKANIVGRHEEFEDLDTLSEQYRKKLRDSEINYQGQSIIPGIPEKQKNRTSVLDN
jgi:general secretion pathway protein D